MLMQATTYKDETGSFLVTRPDPDISDPIDLVQNRTRMTQWTQP